YAQHNMANRDTFGVKMGKQAVSLYAPNYMLRNDTRSYLLHYPEDSLVQTVVMKKVNQAKRPVGTNFVVAIATYYGYNIKDAVVLNQAAVDRGLGRTTFYRTYQSEELRYPGGQKDRFEIPNEDISGYRGEDAYKNLGEDGIIMPETKVAGGELITAKTSPPRFLEEISEFGVVEEKRRENSDTVKIGEDGYVNNVIMTEAETGNRLVKIKVRSEKTPEVGDKFASIHGQKGVVGAIIPQEDMPFTTNGIIPDLILNPHGIPSRMTVAHLIETIGGKVGSLNGRFVDGTPFEGEGEDALRSELHELGFRSDGKERMYDGITGKIIEAEIFIGAVYYRRLHHIVSQKLQVRSRGPVQLLTRQPTEGKIREGGIRFGEMEKDCLVGHGAAMLLQERIVEESDKTTELVCEKCGIIAVNDTIRRKNVCPMCGGSDVHPVEMSYA
ncbi:MAG: DNA-directed RNA polymerase subunit B, partial [Candidatus Diapherotrites archaeon]|nr:DNA-directed RNA polymerase subunit B [Candidatus Diapherotrites archaeon]